MNLARMAESMPPLRARAALPFVVAFSTTDFSLASSSWLLLMGSRFMESL